MKDFFPKTLHPLHIFEEDEVLYAADIEKARVVELSVVMAEMLKFAATQNDQEIQRTLRNSYPDDDILEAFERFATLEREGLLFNRGEGLRTDFVTESQRRKLLVAIPGIAVDSFFDIETLSAGTNMALSHMFHHLINYVDLYFAGHQNRKLAERIYEVNMNVRDFKRLSRRISETYFGILTLHQEHERWLFPLYQQQELPPILVQCHAPRGHGGQAMNSFLRHYAAMRDCDGFTAPSDYVREFYADYVWDPSFFNTLPNGVDSKLFQAEEKLIPIVKRFGEQIDFKLQFIAQAKEETSAQDITPFTSLHGYPEVAENIRQLLIAQEYPDRYLNYILCRGKKLDKSWEVCAEKLGIDVARIQRLFDTSEAEQLFRENIARAADLGIKASPTILVDRHKFQINQLLRASGTPCE